MNIENAKKLISQLERLPDEQFFMGEWIMHADELEQYIEAEYSGLSTELLERFPKGGCKTVGCIAGWAVMLNGLPAPDTSGLTGETYIKIAGDWLGLPYREAQSLFMGWWWSDKGDPLENATRQDAIDQLVAMVAEETERRLSVMETTNA